MSDEFEKMPVPFTQVSNTVLNDPSLSWKAKGVFAYVYMKPEGWTFSAKNMSKNSKDSIDATQSGIRELIDAGYLTKQKQPDGRIKYTAHHEPKQENPFLAEPKTGKSLKGKKPERENPCHNINKDIYRNKNEANVFAVPFQKEHDPEIYRTGIRVLAHLNKKTGRKFKEPAGNLLERIAEGLSFDDAVKIIDNMCSEWKGTDFEKHLQPNTLFKKEKYDGYLNRSVEEPETEFKIKVD